MTYDGVIQTREFGPERKSRVKKLFGYELSMSIVVHERQIYGILDLIGDVGGLLDGLRIIGIVLMPVVSTSAFFSVVFWQLFTVNPHDDISTPVEQKKWWFSSFMLLIAQNCKPCRRKSNLLQALNNGVSVFEHELEVTRLWTRMKVVKFIYKNLLTKKDRRAF